MSLHSVSPTNTSFPQNVKFSFFENRDSYAQITHYSSRSNRSITQSCAFFLL